MVCSLKKWLFVVGGRISCSVLYAKHFLKPIVIYKLNFSSFWCVVGMAKWLERTTTATDSGCRCLSIRFTVTATFRFSMHMEDRDVAATVKRMLKHLQSESVAVVVRSNHFYNNNRTIPGSTPGTGIFFFTLKRNNKYIFILKNNKITF